MNKHEDDTKSSSFANYFTESVSYAFKLAYGSLIFRGKTEKEIDDFFQGFLLISWLPLLWPWLKYFPKVNIFLPSAVHKRVLHMVYILALKRNYYIHPLSTSVPEINLRGRNRIIIFIIVVFIIILVIIIIWSGEAWEHLGGFQCIKYYKHCSERLDKTTPHI